MTKLTNTHREKVALALQQVKGVIQQSVEEISWQTGNKYFLLHIPGPILHGWLPSLLSVTGAQYYFTVSIAF